MAKAKKTEAQPIIDVLHPNDSPPSENSRSIIITKRPLMRDPMMAAATPDSTTASSSPKTTADEPVKTGPLSVSHELVITPPSSSQPSAPVEVVTPPVKAVAPPVEETAPAESNETSVAPDEVPKEPKLDPLNQDAAEAQAEDEEAKRQAEITALVDSQQYFLPVDGLELKRARFFVALGALLIVGLAVVWADLTLDAGLITVQGVPHTSFFKQASATNIAATTASSTQTYTAPLSKYSLRLPTAWKLDISKASATQDSLKAGPASVNNTFGSSSIMFASGSTLAPTDIKAIIDSVHYQKLTHTKGATTYLQELIYHTDQSHYNVIANVVNSNNVKLGDNLKNLTPSFYTTDVNATSQLAVLTTRTNDFSSLPAAEKYTQINAYQQARAVLLSLTSANAPKQ